jgi:serine-type D-Ala-D-Ala carboxypeptidase (penicillin-binding protein 5/6)
MNQPSAAVTLRSLVLTTLLAMAPLAWGLSPKPPSIEASSYILLDHQTGDVLAEQNPDAPLPPASIVKVMTLYVAFDEISKGHISLDDEVLISEKAWRATGSRSFVEVGSRVRLEDLLHGIVIQSGNDASVAVAEHIAGDESVFAQLMNTHAARIGMEDAHFTNASGLPHPEMVASARDIALLSQALIRDFPEFYTWFGEKEFVYNDIRQPNRNRLLFQDSSVDGIKTGHTNAAGYCLAASAIRDGRRLISVVMGTDSPAARTRASRALLEFGFRFFDTAQLFGSAEPVVTERVYGGAQDQVALSSAGVIALTLPRDARSRVTTDFTVNTPLKAPLMAGDVVGEIVVSLDDNELRREPLVVQQDVPKGSLWKRLLDWLRLWWAS